MRVTIRLGGQASLSQSEYPIWNYAPAIRQIA
jgi:hypothetical protein